MIRIGTGFDAHSFTDGRPLILGGVTVPHDKGLAGHSDADVLLHAICDALLGALAMGDIGSHFPDADPKYKDASSIGLLNEVALMVGNRGFRVNNIDTVLIVQEPKIAPFVEQMQKKISEAVGTEIENVSVKATTTEGMGFTGRGEGIAAQAVATLIELPKT